jgi:hypothetical protein
MLLGTVMMSAWGGPKRWRIRWFMSVMIVHGLAIAFAGLYAALTPIVAGMWLMMFTFAMLATLNGPVYQTKVAPEVQGRVFSTITFLAVGLEPIGMLLVGPLTDNFMEPAMLVGGRLTPFFGPLVGVGPGRGMAVVFLIAGILVAGLGVYGWLNPRVRNLEAELPDQLPDDEVEEAIQIEKAVQPAEAGV